MFDDVFGMIEQCRETFRGGVRDSFGESIIADVLDPIHHQIGLLRSFHEKFQLESIAIEQVLQEARSMTLTEGFER